MIIHIPDNKYECLRCGSTRVEMFRQLPDNPLSGHHEGIRCLDCGHEKSEYMVSDWEKEKNPESQVYIYHVDNPIKF